MHIIMRFVMSMLPYMLIAIPVYIVARCAFLRIRKMRSNWHREVVMLLFAAFLIGLASQTVIPGIVSNGSHTVNFIPFKFVWETYTEVFLNDNISYLLINIMGNIILFVPIGLGVPLLWSVSGRLTLVIGFLSSLFIELCQLFMLRGTDVDDLILNTLGVLLGVLLYKLLQRHCAKAIAPFRLK